MMLMIIPKTKIIEMSQVLSHIQVFAKDSLLSRDASLHSYACITNIIRITTTSLRTV